MSVVLIDQEIVHYEVLGRGKPLIFLHSWVGSWRYWIPAMQSVSMVYRTYAIDMWGFGDSAKVAQRYSLHQQIHLLEDFMDKMGIVKCALIGHGLGAIVAILFAVKNPDLVDRIMAVECPIEEANITDKLRISTPQELMDWLVTHDPVMDPILLEGPKADPAAGENSLISLANFNWDGIWDRLTKPVVIVHGVHDPAVLTPSIEPSTLFHEMTQTIFFDQSGHFPMLDESSKFNRLLADFLALPSGESPRRLQVKEEWKRRVR
ncbi:MAG TPA: alpha/beta hydrolase [Longilinea sp.]|nr:alpha/beta hydrolase [Longilinea sp.]